MKIIELIEKLQSAGINHPNQGGCGLIAYALFRALEEARELKGDELFLYCYISNDVDYEKNCIVLATHEFIEARACSHVLLKHDGQFYDINGNENNPDNYFYFHKLSPYIEKQFLFLTSSLRYGNWSCWFDREEELPKIEKVLNIELTELKK